MWHFCKTQLQSFSICIQTYLAHKIDLAKVNPLICDLYVSDMYFLSIFLSWWYPLIFGILDLDFSFKGFSIRQVIGWNLIDYLFKIGCLGIYIYCRFQISLNNKIPWFFISLYFDLWKKSQFAPLILYLKNWSRFDLDVISWKI